MVYKITHTHRQAKSVARPVPSALEILYPEILQTFYDLPCIAQYTFMTLHNILTFLSIMNFFETRVAQSIGLQVSK